MTREEAITILKNKAWSKLLDEAVDTLSQEPCEDAISREDAINKIHHAEINFTITSTVDFSKYRKEIQEIIDHIVEAQTNAIKQLPSVTPMHKHVEPTQKNNDNTLDALGDAISRAEAIKAIKESAESPAFKGFMAMEQYMPEDAIEAIRNLPSVTPSRGWEEMTVPCENCGHDMTFKIAVCGEPSRHKGHWILTSDDDYEYCTCSECGYQNGENWMIGSHIKFCQECGAKMVEPQESEVSDADSD